MSAADVAANLIACLSLVHASAPDGLHGRAHLILHYCSNGSELDLPADTCHARTCLPSWQELATGLQLLTDISTLR